MTVYIVTMPMLGWDCVVGVFDPEHVTKEQLEDEYPGDDYVIVDHTVETSI